MSKAPEFYPRFIQALFHRGKAEVLPMSYLLDQAKKVLAGDELAAMQRVFGEMVAEGRIKDADGGYTWVARD